MAGDILHIVGLANPGETRMGIVSLIWGILSLLWMLLALIPLLGWGNWFMIPFAVVGAILAIIATVAEPTAACRISATSQASKIGCISRFDRITARLSARPLDFKIALNAPPAPIISRMLAMDPKPFSV